MPGGLLGLRRAPWGQSTWRRHPEEIETAFAYVFASGAKRIRFEEYLRKKCADSEEMWRPYLDLIECPVADRQFGRGTPAEASTEAELRSAIEAGPENGGYWLELGRLLAKKHDCTVEAEAAYRSEEHTSELQSL